VGNPVTIQLTIPTPVSNGLALLQTLASATTLSLNGTFTSHSIGSFTVPQRVAITSVGNDSGITWTVIGFDRYGNPQTESGLTGGISVASYTQRDFLTVSSISSSGATAAGVTAGTNGIGSTPWFCKEFGNLGTLGVAIYLANANANVVNFETTMDDPNAVQSLQLLPLQSSVNPQSNVPPLAWPADGLTQIVQTTRAQVSIPHFAWRLTSESGTTATICQVIESTWVNPQASG
jgi:hypothetical protein